MIIQQSKTKTIELNFDNVFFNVHVQSYFSISVGIFLNDLCMDIYFR